MNGQPYEAGTLGAELQALRKDESLNPAERGRQFEKIFKKAAPRLPELAVDRIWSWQEWPERTAQVRGAATDLGVDFVVKLKGGAHVAVQCKCYAPGETILMGHVDSFIADSSRPCFDLRWVVADNRPSRNLLLELGGMNPAARFIDINEFAQADISAPRPPATEPRPLQPEAIEAVVKGLTVNDRGRLIMACGTGKTFVSLRAAELLVPNGGRVLFLTPSIGVTAQSRREWLRHTDKDMTSLVVCSDQTAARAAGDEGLSITEMECLTTTDPKEIADWCHACKPTGLHAIFCTYQSLDKIAAAQARHRVPALDLVICDEAHWTAGRLQDDGVAGARFQDIHDNEQVKAKKRLYMTATPRVYSIASIRAAQRKDVAYVDMEDQAAYGPKLHQLKFSTAVEAGILSDYRVIVMGCDRGSVTEAMEKRAIDVWRQDIGRGRRPGVGEIAKVFGVSQAINGLTKGDPAEAPGTLHRTLAFANSIARSKWYRNAFRDSEVRKRTTRAMEEGQRALQVEIQHLDGTNSAWERRQALDRMEAAAETNTAYLLSNVRLFAEGIDLPSLNAVAFMDPRKSPVDIVQAVGRAMRKAPGKRYGYIIVPVVIPPGMDIADALEQGTEGYDMIGKVLRALRAHDERLTAETFRDCLQIWVPEDREDALPPVPQDGLDSESALDRSDQLSFVLDDIQSSHLYPRVVEASGIFQRGQETADDVKYAIDGAAAMLENEDAAARLAAALGLDLGTGADKVCVIGALVLCNAALLHKRLGEDDQAIERMAGLPDPLEFLVNAWRKILERDYAPVFEPALAALEAIRMYPVAKDVMRRLAECADSAAEGISKMGYDHAGPLYHKVLGTAKSDGAYYTNNVSALLLAKLAFPADFIDWTDTAAIKKLRIMDPACGTGTLLMATLRTIKDRAGKEADPELHCSLVENVLCGADINRHAVQFAACNLTLGATSVSYRKMNLYTLSHGPQSDGSIRAGSLDWLINPEDPLSAMAAPLDGGTKVAGRQIDDSKVAAFPVRGLDAVIMNPPFTDNVKRGSKYPREVVQQMQRHEARIKGDLAVRDREAGNALDSTSIRTFFTSLADQMLNGSASTLAMVMPVTACVGSAGQGERLLLAKRFHIELVITSHDPKEIAFSGNTDIHECLVVARRLTNKSTPPPPPRNSGFCGACRVTRRRSKSWPQPFNPTRWAIGEQPRTGQLSGWLKAIGAPPNGTMAA